VAMPPASCPMASIFCTLPSCLLAPVGPAPRVCAPDVAREGDDVLLPRIRGSWRRPRRDTPADLCDARSRRCGSLLLGLLPSPLHPSGGHRSRRELEDGHVEQLVPRVLERGTPPGSRRRRARSSRADHGLRGMVYRELDTPQHTLHSFLGSPHCLLLVQFRRSAEP